MLKGLDKKFTSQLSDRGAKLRYMWMNLAIEVHTRIPSTLQCSHLQSFSIRTSDCVLLLWTMEKTMKSRETNKAWRNSLTRFWEAMHASRWCLGRKCQLGQREVMGRRRVRPICKSPYQT